MVSYLDYLEEQRLDRYWHRVLWRAAGDVRRRIKWRRTTVVATVLTPAAYWVLYRDGAELRDWIAWAIAGVISLLVVVAGKFVLQVARSPAAMDRKVRRRVEELEGESVALRHAIETVEEAQTVQIEPRAVDGAEFSTILVARPNRDGSVTLRVTTPADLLAEHCVVEVVPSRPYVAQFSQGKHELVWTVPGHALSLDSVLVVRLYSGTPIDEVAVEYL